ncbi:galactose-specific lectin nattectin-like [Sparus aurata]|uniref:galactose-specific lectin nattectin-like n=1 Tax=Sparus aurata TaxID=8175 RepID=UPI0011C120DD|nr:galactose-specific lectin nattectin-like [Sparus aurata]
MDMQTERPAVRADLHNSSPVQSALSRALWTSSGGEMASALPLVLLCLAVSAAAACPSGWTRIGSRCFTVQRRSLTMVDAELNCIRLGGNLASIHSYREHILIRGLIRRGLHFHARVWIGLTDAVQEGKWLWTDGSRFVFSRWGSGEPNNDRGREDCTEIIFRGEYWNDARCTNRYASVCVRRH